MDRSNATLKLDTKVCTMPDSCDIWEETKIVLEARELADTSLNHNCGGDTSLMSDVGDSLAHDASGDCLVTVSSSNVFSSPEPVASAHGLNDNFDAMDVDLVECVRASDTTSDLQTNCLPSGVLPEQTQSGQEVHCPPLVVASDNVLKPDCGNIMVECTDVDQGEVNECGDIATDEFGNGTIATTGTAVEHTNTVDGVDTDINNITSDKNGAILDVIEGRIAVDPDTDNIVNGDMKVVGSEEISEGDDDFIVTLDEDEVEITDGDVTSDPATMKLSNVEVTAISDANDCEVQDCPAFDDTVTVADKMEDSVEVTVTLDTICNVDKTVVSVANDAQCSELKDSDGSIAVCGTHNDNEVVMTVDAQNEGIDNDGTPRFDSGSYEIGESDIACDDGKVPVQFSTFVQDTNNDNEVVMTVDVTPPFDSGSYEIGESDIAHDNGEVIGSGSLLAEDADTDLMNVEPHPKDGETNASLPQGECHVNSSEVDTALQSSEPKQDEKCGEANDTLFVVECGETTGSGSATDNVLMLNDDSVSTVTASSIDSSDFSDVAVDNDKAKTSDVTKNGLVSTVSTTDQSHIILTTSASNCSPTANSDTSTSISMCIISSTTGQVIKTSIINIQNAGSELSSQHSVHNISPSVSQASKSAIDIRKPAEPTSQQDKFRPLGHLLLSVGKDIVSQVVFREIVDQEDRWQSSTDAEKEKIERIKKAYARIVEKNTAYNHQKAYPCRCTFVASTRNELAKHREYGHIRTSQKDHRTRVFACCYCDGFEARTSSQFAMHMMLSHCVKARFERPLYLQCRFCAFESDNALAWSRHVHKCRLSFKSDMNLALPSELFDIPLYVSDVSVSVTPGLATKAALSRTNVVNAEKMNGFGTNATQPKYATRTEALKKHVVVVPNVRQVLPLTVPQYGVIGTVESAAKQNSGPSQQPLHGKDKNVKVITPSQSAAEMVSNAARAAAAAVMRFASNNGQALPIAPGSLIRPRPRAGNRPVINVLSGSNPTVLAPFSLPGLGRPRGIASPGVPSVPRTGMPTRPVSSIMKPAMSALIPLQVVSAVSSMHGSKFVPVQIIANQKPRFEVSPTPSANSQSPICEVCGMVIDTMANLRSHLWNDHGIIISRQRFFGPEADYPVPCPACPKRFFCSLGLERHQRLFHETAKKTTSSCIRCNEVGIADILAHFRDSHHVSLCDMVDWRICCMCKLNFVDLKELQKHMLVAHSDLFPSLGILVEKINAGRKKVTLVPTTSFTGPGAVRQPLIPSAVTSPLSGQIIGTLSTPNYAKGIRAAQHTPQFRMNLPLPVASFDKSPMSPFPDKKQDSGRQGKRKFRCQACSSRFFTSEQLTTHRNEMHNISCSRCVERFDTVDLMKSHFMAHHQQEKERCVLCSDIVQIGRPMVRHMKRMHVNECSVVLERLSKCTIMKYCPDAVIDDDENVAENGEKINMSEQKRKRQRKRLRRDSLGNTSTTDDRQAASDVTVVQTDQNMSDACERSDNGLKEAEQDCQIVGSASDKSKLSDDVVQDCQVSTPHVLETVAGNPVVTSQSELTNKMAEVAPDCSAIAPQFDNDSVEQAPPVISETCDSHSQECSVNDTK